MKFELKHKNKRKSDLDELIQKSLDVSKEVREVPTDKISKRERITKSLLYSDDKDCHKISKKISDCKKYQRVHYQKRGLKHLKGSFWDDKDPLTEIPKLVSQYINDKNVCQSLWCPHCRKHLTKLYQNKILKKISERLLPHPYTNGDFHHLSGVLGLCEVDPKEVLQLIDGDTNRWRRIRYRVSTLINPKYDPFVETVYEFELVNWTFLKNSQQSDFKKKQIQQLIEHQKFKGSVFLFVHFHSITNLSKDQITEVFRNEYFVGNKPLLKTNKQNGLYVQKFHTDQSLEKNIEKLCSYPFKDPHRFKHSFRGSDYLNGEYYEYEELSQLIKVYQKVQKRSWRGLFRSVEHPKSVEYLKYRKLFPSNFVRTDMGVRKEKLRTDQIRLEEVWMVDNDGEVFTEGWNPNNFFPNGLEVTIIQQHRTKIGTEWYYNEYEHKDMVRNIYRKDKDDTSITKTILVEEFYYPKEYKLLKKDQSLFINEKGQYRRDLSNMGKKDWGKVLRNIRIKDVQRVPKDVEFSIDDELLLQRLETLQRLDKTQQTMYFNHKIQRHIKPPQTSK